MSLHGRLSVLCVLMLMTTVSVLSRYSVAQHRAPRAQVLATGAEIHAIVNSIAIGSKPTFEGTRGEFPIRHTVAFHMPEGMAPAQYHIYVLLEGMVVAQAADNAYADPLQAWRGFKTHTPEQEKMTTCHDGVSLQVTMDDTPAAVFPLGELYRYKQITQGQTTVRYVQYSFKQNRLLVEIQPAKPLTSLTILTADLETASLGYLGFFRVHLFGPVTEAPREDTRVRFTWYGQPAIEVPVGQPLALGSAADFLYPGDFLCPVGLRFATDQAATTSRLLTGLRPGATITMEVTGVFLFSGFHAFTAIGGSGGWQDLAYRYDHARFGLSPHFYPFYPIDKPIHVLMYRNDFRFVLYDTAGTEIVYTFKPLPKSHAQLRSSSTQHRYEVVFTAPPEGKVYGFINDNELGKTRDNSGAFLVRVLAQR